MLLASVPQVAGDGLLVDCPTGGWVHTAGRGGGGGGKGDGPW